MTDLILLYFTKSFFFYFFRIYKFLMLQLRLLLSGPVNVMTSHPGRQVPLLKSTCYYMN